MKIKVGSSNKQRKRQEEDDGFLCLKWASNYIYFIHYIYITYYYLCCKYNILIDDIKVFICSMYIFLFK